MNELVWIVLLGGVMGGGVSNTKNYEVFTTSTALNSFVESNKLDRPRVFVGRKLNFSDKKSNLLYYVQEFPDHECDGKPMVRISNGKWKCQVSNVVFDVRDEKIVIGGIEQ